MLGLAAAVCGGRSGNGQVLIDWHGGGDHNYGAECRYVIV